MFKNMFQHFLLIFFPMNFFLLILINFAKCLMLSNFIQNKIFIKLCSQLLTRFRYVRIQFFQPGLLLFRGPNRFPTNEMLEGVIDGVKIIGQNSAEKNKKQFLKFFKTSLFYAFAHHHTWLFRSFQLW